MAPRFSDEELVQQLNNIFNESESKTVVKVNYESIRSPTVDSTRDIIIAVLTEAGFSLNTNIMNLPNDLTGLNELNVVKDYLTPMTLYITANKFFGTLSSAALEKIPIHR